MKQKLEKGTWDHKKKGRDNKLKRRDRITNWWIHGFVTRKGVKIENVPIIHDYGDVFPKVLLGLPPEREIAFEINLIPRAKPISKAPYRMTPAELRELKTQL